MSLFINRYRIESARLEGFDYSSEGCYFITICTNERKHIFGEISDGIMALNDAGNIVMECWNDLPNHYPNLILDEFVIMPDHVHGIMIIDNTNTPNVGDNGRGGAGVGGGVGDGIGGEYCIDDGIVETGGDGIDGKYCIDDGIVETGLRPVSTKTTPVPSKTTSTTPSKTTAPAKTPYGVSEFVRALKSFSARKINELNNTPGKNIWQSRFHDHIIRSTAELNRIRQYIINNSHNWPQKTS
jgi:REP element-mobilizing transposase RayT